MLTFVASLGLATYRAWPRLKQGEKVAWGPYDIALDYEEPDTYKVRAEWRN